MTPPRWLYEHGKLLATRPCHRCGTPVPVGRTFRLEHMRMIGWQLFTEAQIVQWCGHAQHFLVVPDADGERAALVPIFGGGGVMAVAALLLAILTLVACSITPEQRELIERTWAERERERAQECARIRCGQSAP